MNIIKKPKFPGVIQVIDTRVNTCNAALLKDVYIKSVIYNNPATIVFWSDDTKTISKCLPGDTYSKEAGLAIYILKKINGAAAIKDIFDTWVSADNKITLRNIRAAKRKKASAVAFKSIEGKGSINEGNNSEC